MTMNAVLSFALPDGYRVTSSEAADPVVECQRGCGWKMHVTLLSSLAGDARDRLFRFHEQWHSAR